MVEQKGFIRKTKQREVILQVLRSAKSSADWIIRKSARTANISLGTIYRNLKTLTEMEKSWNCPTAVHTAGLNNADNHYHFVCEECGNVLC